MNIFSRIGKWFVTPCSRAIVIGSTAYYDEAERGKRMGRYSGDIARVRNAEFGTEYQGATEAARAVKDREGFWK
jgi:hypothetical protein